MQPQKGVYISKFSMRAKPKEFAQPALKPKMSPSRERGLSTPSSKLVCTPSRLTEPTISSAMKKKVACSTTLSSFQIAPPRPKAEPNKENMNSLPVERPAYSVSKLVDKSSQPIDVFKSSNFSFIEMLKSQRQQKAFQQQRSLGIGQPAAVLTAQSSRPNSSLSSPRLTPLRMIERNRGFDREHLSSLESKIKELESQITSVKKVGEDRKLDKLEQSLCVEDCPVEPSLLLDDELEPLSPEPRLQSIQTPKSAQLPLCLKRQFINASSLQDALQQLLCFVDQRIKLDEDASARMEHLKGQLMAFVNPIKKSTGV